MIDVRGNSKFFKPRRLLSYIGGVIALSAFPAYFITVSFLPVVILVAVGAICIVVNREMNELEDDFLRSLERLRTDFANAFSEAHYDVKHPERRMLIKVLPSFIRKDEHTLTRRLAKGSLITSQYRLCAIGLLPDCLLIREAEFDLLSEEEPEPRERSYPYTACGCAVCIEPTGDTPARLVLTDSNGEQLFESTVPFDNDTDILVDNLNHRIERARSRSQTVS